VSTFKRRSHRRLNLLERLLKLLLPCLKSGQFKLCRGTFGSQASAVPCSAFPLRAISSSSTKVVATMRDRHLSSCGVREWRNASLLRSDAVHCCNLSPFVVVRWHRRRYWDIDIKSQNDMYNGDVFEARKLSRCWWCRSLCRRVCWGLRE